MRKLKFFATALILFFLISCQKENNSEQDQPVTSTPLYFPPIGSNAWDGATPASLGWNETELNKLYSYLQQKNTKAFIILKNGKIVAEKYFGTFTTDSSWYWGVCRKNNDCFFSGYRTTGRRT